MPQFASFDFEAMPAPDCYRLTTSTVVPRPIAWVVTQGRDGVVNAAPFSFFNVLGGDPVVLGLGVGAAASGGRKDTGRNILESGEFVVNLVPDRLGPAMNITAANAPPGISELDLAALDHLPSVKVAPPRIAASPVAFECKVMHALETGPRQLTIIGRVVQMHIAAEALTGDPARPRVRTEALAMLGRMHGSGWYARTTDLFQMERPADWTQVKP